MVTTGERERRRRGERERRRVRQSDRKKVLRTIIDCCADDKVNLTLNMILN